MLKNCAPFANSISETNNTQIDNAKYISAVMPMYTLIEYSGNHSKTSGSLWQYYSDESTLAADGAPANFPGNGASLKYKQKITGSTGNDGTNNGTIEIFKYFLGNSWNVINCKISLILTWSASFAISNATVNQATTFTITDTKLHVLVVTLSIDNNAKLLQQLKSGFKRTINWNRYETKTKQRMLQTNTLIFQSNQVFME